MADGQLIGTSFSVNIENNLEKNEEIKCQCCVTLKADLQAAKQKVSSYREIIKILLESNP
jgi:predicted methyltransferase